MTSGSPPCLAGAERAIQKPCSCPGSELLGEHRPPPGLPLCALTRVLNPTPNQGPRPILPQPPDTALPKPQLLLPSPSLSCPSSSFSQEPPLPQESRHEVSAPRSKMFRRRGRCVGIMPRVVHSTAGPGLLGATGDTDKGQADFQLVCPGEVVQVIKYFD